MKEIKRIVTKIVGWRNRSEINEIMTAVQDKVGVLEELLEEQCEQLIKNKEVTN